MDLADSDFRNIADLDRATTRGPARAARRWSQGDDSADLGRTRRADGPRRRGAAARRRRAGRHRADLCGAMTPRLAAVFLGALRAGAAVAPLAHSVTPRDLRRRCAATPAPAPAVRRRRTRRRCSPTATRARCVSLDGLAPGTAFDDWLAPAGARPAPVEVQPDDAVQHHLFVGNDRHAEGHRAAARDALAAHRSAARATATAATR